MPPLVITAPASDEQYTVESEHSQAIHLVPQAKSFWDLLNLSIGFLGIQFGWAIQMGQMNALLERLGADPRLAAWFFCAGPVTGVLVQPIIGALSDRCGLSW